MQLVLVLNECVLFLLPQERTGFGNYYVTEPIDSEITTYLSCFGNLLHWQPLPLI